ncbi:MAG: cupredoxin domain-containing protein [Candidatus Ratteibacteria bacterium]
MVTLRKSWWLVVLFLGLSVSFASAAVKSIKGPGDISAQTGNSSTVKAPSQIKEFTVIAKKYEFNPAEIRVKQGDTVRIILAPKDATHGFMIKEYNINISAKKGETKQVEFLADKTGTFVFRCSVFCGMGHFKMQGKLIVE